MCDTTHHKWHDWFIWETLVPPSFIGGAPPHICINIIHWMSHSYDGLNSFICGTWLIHMWHITLSHDLFTCDTHMGRGAPPVAHVNESRSTHERVTHHIYICQDSASSVAVCCSVLQRATECCSAASQHSYSHLSAALWWVAARCSVLQCVAVCFSVLQCAAVSIRSFILFKMRICVVERHALQSVRDTRCYQYRFRVLIFSRPARIHICTNTGCDSFTCATRLIHACDMTHSYVWETRESRFVITTSCVWCTYVWRDSVACVTWRIHMCERFVYLNLWWQHFCVMKIWRSHVAHMN